MTPQERAGNLNAAQAQLNAQNFAGARKHVQAVLASDPGDARALSLMAACELGAGELTAARATARDAVAADPGLATAHRILAMAELRNGRVGAAKWSIDEALRIEPDDSITIAVQCQVLYAQRHFHEMLEAADKALPRRPNSVPLLLSKVNALAGLARFAEAEPVARRAYAIEPDTPRTLAANGLISLYCRNIEAAENFAALALRIAPADRDVLRLVCQLEMRRSKSMGLLWHAMAWTTRLGGAKLGWIIAVILTGAMTALVVIPIVNNESVEAVGHSIGRFAYVFIGMFALITLAGCVQRLAHFFIRRMIARRLRRTNLSPHF